MVCYSPVVYGVYLTFRALSLSLLDEVLTLETSVKHHIPQANNIHVPYQPLLIKPIFHNWFTLFFPIPRAQIWMW